MPKKIDITGKRYGKLLVIKESDKRVGASGVFWECLCDCGNTVIKATGRLNSGNTKSCGCLSKETQFQNKHNMCFSTEYRSWQSMKQRVLNPKSHENPKKRRYANIQIDPRWIESFEAFYEDMGKAPSEKHTIDRVDNEKGYFSDNCRWATAAEQNRNYSLNKMITYNNKTMCVMDWSKELGFPHYILYQRLRKGWSVEKTFETPVRTVNSKN